MRAYTGLETPLLTRLAPASLLVLLAFAAPAIADDQSAGAARFDGARERTGSVPDAPTVGTLASPQDQALLDALLARVQVRPDDDPRAGAAIRDAFSSLLKTKTGKDLATAFVAENARATVGFGTIDGSAVVSENGIKVMNGSGGFTEPWKDPPAVTLNRAYLDCDENYRRVEIARVLGHEMLGHGFERQRAVAAGLSDRAMQYYRGDEGNASMIGWLVQSELGGKLINGHMWNYLSSPDKFYDTIEFQTAFYATSLSAQQMLDPIPEWKKRLGRVDEKRAELDAGAKDMLRWQKIALHFVNAHGISADRFANIGASIRYELVDYVPAARKNLDQIQKSLQSAIDYASGPSGAALLSEMHAAGSSDYIRGVDQRLDGYAQRLATEVSGRHQESVSPPDPNQITWSQLDQMWNDDDPAHKALIP